MERDHVKLPNWKTADGKTFQRPKGPFDGALVEIPPDTVNALSRSILFSSEITLSITCSQCKKVLDFSDYCEDCDGFDDVALRSLLKRGAPYPEPPDEYCVCGWLRNYCLCHLNLALFSNKRHKPEQ